MNELPDTGTAYPRSHEQVPFDVLRDGRYEASFARDQGDLDALLRLRYEVFNLELEEGLEESHLTGRDRDRFDDVCHHLVVRHRDSHEVVGTYRMQTSEMASQGIGFYSAGEFDLTSLPASVLGDAVEVGRACVAKEHRNTFVLFMLWKGLARYMAINNRRYLFGCCSLTSQDPAEGLAVMQRLERQGHLHPTLRILPQPGFECYDEEAPPEIGPEIEDKIPQLFKIYLRHGARVCGPPAIDREFKTIDYLVIFDVAAMDERHFRRFFG